MFDIRASLKFIDLGSVLVLVLLWATIRFLSEILTILNIKSLILFPFFLFLLSIILIGRKIATYICHSVKDNLRVNLQQSNASLRLSIYIILGYFFTWITVIIVSSITSLGRYIIPFIFIIFSALPDPIHIHSTRSSSFINLLNVNKIKELFVILRRLCDGKFVLLLLLQIILIISSLVEFVLLPQSYQLRSLDSLLAGAIFTAYLLPLIIGICISLGLFNRKLGTISIFTTVLYLSAILSARGFTHFGTDVYATLYPIEALIEGNPEVSIFSFTSGKYGYLHWLVLNSIGALLSLISGLHLNFYAIEASISLIIFPSLLGMASLLSYLLHDWRLANFTLVHVFLINFLLIKRLWWFVPFSFMITLFLITLSIIISYKLEKGKIPLPIIGISLIITSFTHPIGLALSLITLAIFLSDEIKFVISSKKSVSLILMIIAVSFMTFLILGREFVMNALYSLGLEHIFSRNPEIKLSLENSTLLSLSSNTSFYNFWGVLLILCICGVLKMRAVKAERIPVNKSQMFRKMFLLTTVLLIAYIFTDFVFTRQYIGVSGDRFYLILSILACVLVITFFDIVFKSEENTRSYFCKERFKLRMVLHKKYWIIFLLTLVIISYVLICFNGNLRLTPRENLSYLYFNEVKLLHEFLTKREYEDALVLSHPEVLAYARSFIPIINWWRVEGFPVIFPDSESYGAFGGAYYWKTYNTFIKYGNITSIKIHAQERKANQEFAYVIILYKLCGLGCVKFKEYGKVIVENDMGFVLELPLNQKKENY